MMGKTAVEPFKEKLIQYVRFFLFEFVLNQKWLSVLILVRFIFLFQLKEIGRFTKPNFSCPQNPLLHYITPKDIYPYLTYRKLIWASNPNTCNECTYFRNELFARFQRLTTGLQVNLCSHHHHHHLYLVKQVR